VFEDIESFSQHNPAVPCAAIMVIEDREISDNVEERFGIRHESPQAILIDNEKAVWHASHWKVTESTLGAAIAGRSAGARPR
jgi:bacillithiol system protein YtxJ